MKTFDRKSYALHVAWAGIVAMSTYILANIGSLQTVLAGYVSPEVAGFILAVVAAFLKKLADSKPQ